HRRSCPRVGEFPEFPGSFTGHNLALAVDHNFSGAIGYGCGRDMTSMPTHPNARGLLGSRHHLSQTVLRAVAGTGMDFAGGTLMVLELQPQDGVDSGGIARQSSQFHPQAWRS